MRLLILCLLPTLAYLTCILPATTDGTIIDNWIPRQSLEVYSPGDTISLRCEFCNPTCSYQWLTCKNDSSWNVDSQLDCNILVREPVLLYPYAVTRERKCDYPFDFFGTVCTSSQWSLTLRFPQDIHSFDIRSFRISNWTDLDINIEIYTALHHKHTCKVNILTAGHYSSPCSVNNAINFTITSNKILYMHQLNVYSQFKHREGSSDWSWFLDKYIVELKDKKNFEEAESDCNKANGTLAKIRSNEEATQIKSILEIVTNRRDQEEEFYKKTFFKDYELSTKEDAFWIGLFWINSYSRVTLTGKDLIPIETKEDLAHSYICNGSPVRNCPSSPGVPAGGRIKIHEQNKRVTYECKEGLRLVGKSDRYCNVETGFYEGDIPICVNQSSNVSRERLEYLFNASSIIT